jgi:hypothetical protein
MDDLQQRIDVLRPCAGDTIVLTVPGRLTDKQRDQIRRVATEWLPVSVKVLVLDSGISVAHIAAPAHAPAVAAPAEPVHFDTWYRHRINVAHAKYMERTSYSLRCDWSTFPPEAIKRYLDGPGV